MLLTLVLFSFPGTNVPLAFPYETLLLLSTIKFNHESEGLSNGDKNRVLAKASLGEHRTSSLIHFVHKLTLCRLYTAFQVYIIMLCFFLSKEVKVVMVFSCQMYAINSRFL